MSGLQERRIIVEVVTPESVRRLEAENDALRQELNLLKGQHERLHSTVYRLMEKFGELNRKLGKS